MNSKTEKSNLRFEPLDNTGKLSLKDAKFMEQLLINKFGLQKNGGQLYNKIYSISPSKWHQYGIAH